MRFHVVDKFLPSLFKFSKHFTHFLTNGSASLFATYKQFFSGREVIEEFGQFIKINTNSGVSCQHCIFKMIDIPT
ncbi:hypothetical protein ASU91_17330 [Enterobacter hormaechei subsp. steigerwaltii]|nr:hypothetical protein SS35_25225 [Enterobacter hormaechei subsp. steigerwaltii]KJL66550.1 hypothetical protein SS62_11135 [Enterobacter hormaechei subsp. xiangfangensis]KJL77884.1 hypothetical protein SS24_24620 [Enterobacter hormaechei subsp. steigerwaltii]KJL78364.1 hypothetical protein SS61_24785 [Enterobacter hormaechei subsp. steigerwaltii]KJW76911.1 hypothetical protein SG68_24855 [Enterobacter hormaechei subsp. steigerwaltii]